MKFGMSRKVLFSFIFTTLILIYSELESAGQESTMTIKLKGHRSDSSTVVRVAVIYSEEALSSYRGLPENTNYCEKKSIKNIRRESFEYNEYSKEGTIELPAVKHGYCVVALFVDYDGDCILDEKKDIRKIAKGNIPFWFISSLRFPEELGSKNNPIKFNF